MSLISAIATRIRNYTSVIMIRGGHNAGPHELAKWKVNTLTSSIIITC